LSPWARQFIARQDAFVLFEDAELLLEDVVFALALREADQLQAFALEEVFDGLDEGLGHIDGLLGGGEAMAQLTAAEGGDAALAGELGDVGVEVHPIDALQFQDHVILLEFGQAVGYVHGEFRLGVCAPEHGVTAASRQYTRPQTGKALQGVRVPPEPSDALLVRGPASLGPIGRLTTAIGKESGGSLHPPPGEVRFRAAEKSGKKIVEQARVGA
jgi:hypothetical protein